MPDSEFRGVRGRFVLAILGPAMLIACQATPGAPPPPPPTPAPEVRAPPAQAVMPRLTDVDEWVRVFDDPARDSWQRPDAVVAAMDIPPGSTVADIGAGTGYFNPWLARAVGPQGHVVAVDIEPALIAHLRERAIAEDTPQVDVRLGEPGDPKLAPGEVDRVLLVDTYAYIADRPTYFGTLVAAMKPGGRLVVVDFAPGGSPHGPPASERLDAEVVVDEMDAAGWDLLAQPLVLAEQYVLVFEAR